MNSFSANFDWGIGLLLHWKGYFLALAISCLRCNMLCLSAPPATARLLTPNAVPARPHGQPLLLCLLALWSCFLQAEVDNSNTLTDNLEACLNVSHMQRQR